MTSITTPAPPVLDRVRFAALDLQHAPIRPLLVAAFERLLDSSAFTLGSEVEAFEEAFGRYCGAEHCVGVSSGTAALELMLRAHGIGPGDEVVVPAHTFIASALAVAHAGATPVLCDVHPDTGLIDADAVRAAVGPRTAAVLAVHLYGQACDMEALGSVARSAGLLVLEDAAQAVGADWDGRGVGSLGHSAAFSFYPGKNLGALGDGGAVCTSDPTVAQAVRRLRNLGQQRKGEHVQLGFNERLDGLQAALLSVKLEFLDGWTEVRRRRAADYRELLGDRVAIVTERERSLSVQHVFAIRVAERDAIARRLGERGVETGVHYAHAVHEHPAWAGELRIVGDLDHSEAWAAQELSLPMHQDLTRSEVERVVQELDEALTATGVSEG